MSDALSQSDIDALLAAAAGPAPGPVGAGGGSPMRASSAASAGDTSTVRSPGGKRRTVRTMDFARPSKFNKDQLRTIQMLHESFARRASTYLSGVVRSLAEVSVVGAEQVPYGDFIGTLPVPTFTTVLECHPLGTNAMASLDMPLVFGILDRMLGGPGVSGSKLRELTEIEMALGRSMMEHLVEELSEAWTDIVGVDFRMRGVEMNAQFAQIAAGSEPSVLVTMEISIGTVAGTLSICIPYRSIEKVVGELTAHRYFAVDDTDEVTSRELLLQGLRRVTMPVRAVVGETPISVDEVLALQPGDVVSLGQRVEEGIRLAVGTTRVYRALPGRDGRYVAVRVMERVDQIQGHDTLLGNGEGVAA